MLKFALNLKIKAKKVLRMSGVVLAASVVALIVGELVAWICSAISGAQFTLFGTVQGVGFDNVIMLIFVILLAVMAVYVYLTFRRKAVRDSSSSMRASASVNAAKHHAYTVLYGTLSLLFVLSIVTGSLLQENMMFMIPLFCATAAMILYHLTNMRVWLLLAIAVILLHAFSFLYVLSMALTIGAFGAVMMLALFDLLVLIPLADMYMMPIRRK